MKFSRLLARFAMLGAVLVAASGCSTATKLAAHALSAPGDTITSDDDPELVRKAIPTFLKLQESFLSSLPKDGQLLLSACSGFTGYSYLFVESDAEILGDAEHHDEVKALRAEALSLYVRARDYCLRALDVRFKGITQRLYRSPQSAFEKIKLKKEDVPLLYWSAASWGSAISLGLDHIELIGDFPAVRALADQAMRLDPDFNRGALYELMMTLDSLPEALGGAPKDKRDAVLKSHFDHAVRLQQGLSPGPYVSMAAHIDISDKDPSEYPKLREEYTKFLDQALAIDPNKDKSNRLLTIITQRRAKAMLEQIDTKIPEDFTMALLKRIGLMFVLVAAVGVTVRAVPDVTWRLSTAAPDGSIWDKALRDMTAAWTRDTGGRVKANVFSGGKLGTEVSVVRAMRQASPAYDVGLFMLTGGLAQIDDGFNALAIPFFFKDDAENKAVRDAVTPALEKRLNAKGFHLLAWTSGGGVRLFSTKPLKTLDDIKKTNLWTSDSDTKMVTWYKANGFHPVPLDANAVGAQLKIGMIDASPSPAYLALLLHLYDSAKFMLDVNLGPFLGGLVVTTKAWNAVSPEDQAKITAAAKEFEKSTSVAMPAEDGKAVTEMKNRGLTLVQMTPKDSADLYAAIDRLVASMRGDMVPADMYDQVKDARDAYRKRK